MDITLAIAVGHRDTAAHDLTLSSTPTTTKDPVEEPEPGRSINNAYARNTDSRHETDVARINVGGSGLSRSLHSV